MYEVTEVPEHDWTRFRGSNVDGSPYTIDALIRPKFQDEMRELRRSFLQRSGAGQNVTEAVPPELIPDLTAAIADRIIVRLGGPDIPDHPNGLLVAMSDTGLVVSPKRLAKYGVPTLTPGMDAGEITKQPWPMTPEGKYALIEMFTDFSIHVNRFADKLGTPVGAATEEEREQDDANLEPTPSSAPSSPSETAPDEK